MNKAWLTGRREDTQKSRQADKQETEHGVELRKNKKQTNRQQVKGKWQKNTQMRLGWWGTGWNTSGLGRWSQQEELGQEVKITNKHRKYWFQSKTLQVLISRGEDNVSHFRCHGVTPDLVVKTIYGRCPSFHHCIWGACGENNKTVLEKKLN